MALNETKVRNLAGFVWGVADLLRGDFKRFEYGKVILPFVILRRLDCLIADVRTTVAEAATGLPAGIDDAARDAILSAAAGKGPGVYNTSGLSFDVIKGQEPTQVQQNLVAYLMGFSPSLKEIFIDKFAFVGQLERLGKAELLWKVFEEFQELDLSPGQLENVEMGYLFEDLIRRFSEISNETAGEHFTPREVIRLVVDLLTINDQEALRGSGIIRTVYDCAVGTGGMLAVAEERLHNMNDRIKVQLFGQELNEESFAICKSDMLVKGHDPEQIAFGNSLSQDAHRNRRFHYMLANPPYGVDWKKYAEPIKAEFESLGENGRFGAGLPRVSDGQLLFLQHMISKMRDDAAGSRIGIVMNGSPLFTGGAGSGESEIRRWILENDWLEAIVALPTDLFYNTGIQTYVWLLSNRKEARRRGKVQLIDASGQRFWNSLRRNLGSKRREIPDEARNSIVGMFHRMENGGSEWSDVSKIFDTKDFGYREIKVERPLRLNYLADPERISRLRHEKAFLKLEEGAQEDIVNVLTNWMSSTLYQDGEEFEKAFTKAMKGASVKIGAPVKNAILTALSERDETAKVRKTQNGKIEADPQLRDYELVPLSMDWKNYVSLEVAPYADDAWVDEEYRDDTDQCVGRVGYEINFSKYFFKPKPVRSLDEIDNQLQMLEAEISALLKGIGA